MKLTQSDLRMILRSLDHLKVLTELTRHNSRAADIPFDVGFEARVAQATIREKILSVALADVVVEQEAA